MRKMSNPIDELNSKKDLLIESIIKAINPYSDFNDKQLREFVTKTIHDAKVFFKDPTPTYIEIPFKEKYQKQLNKLSSTLTKISKINHTITLGSLTPITTTFDEKSHQPHYTNNHTTHKVYKNYRSSFNSLNISLPLLEQVYANSGKEAFLRYVSTIFKVYTKLNDYDFKVELENQKLKSQNSLPTKNINHLLHEYDAKDLFELRDFYNKLRFVTSDYNAIDEISDYKKECIEIILQKTNQKTLTAKTLKKNIKQIESLFSNHALKAFFTMNKLKDSTKDVIKTCNLNNLSIDDYSSIISALLTLNQSSNYGVCEFVKDTSLIGLKSTIFSFNGETQAEIIVHEYIHTLEIINKDDFNYFRKHYGAINEMLTEQLARIAMRHFYPNEIFSVRDNSKPTIHGYAFYDSKTGPLFGTQLLHFLLKAKVNGTLRGLSVEVGKPILDKITKALNYEDSETGKEIMREAVMDFKKFRNLYFTK